MDLAWSTQWRLLVTSNTSMQGPLYKVHVWKGPGSDLIDCGLHGEGLPKTSQGPFFPEKNGHFCFPAGHVFLLEEIDIFGRGGGGPPQYNQCQ